MVVHLYAYVNLMYLALVNMVHLSGDGGYRQWFQHTAFTDQALGAVQREVCPTAGADCHLEGRLGASLGKGSKP